MSVASLQLWAQEREAGREVGFPLNRYYTLNRHVYSVPHVHGPINLSPFIFILLTILVFIIFFVYIRLAMDSI